MYKERENVGVLMNEHIRELFSKKLGSYAQKNQQKLTSSFQRVISQIVQTTCNIMSRKKYVCGHS